MGRISTSPQFVVEDEPVIETIISPKINFICRQFDETRIHFSFYSQASCNALTSLCTRAPHYILSDLSNHLALDILRAIYSKCTTEKKGKFGHRDILHKGFRHPDSGGASIVEKSLTK
jgi:hypothetical protein